MPKLTTPLVRQALRDVTEPMQLRDALYYYVLGWTEEMTTLAGENLPSRRFIGFDHYCYLNYYDAGSRDYAMALALEKGPINGFTNDRRPLLTTSDPDTD